MLLLVALPVINGQTAVPHVITPDEYKGIHGVVGDPTELNMFRKIGSGECLAPASRPVRGKARMDMGHLECRFRCIEPCIGYTYAPCQRICTLHGSPAKLFNTSESDGWAIVNGGGIIEKCSQRCGSSCYNRLPPCKPGQVVSNQAVILTNAMAYGSFVDAQCPDPFVGTLRLRCGQYGPYVEAGRCRSACKPGIVVNGNFDVPYGQFKHGSMNKAICPSGASGDVLLSCNDGKANVVDGWCGYDCVMGSLIVGDAVVAYQTLAHMAEYNVTCPGNTVGNVTLQCWDSQVTTINGSCNLNCEAGEMELRVGDTTGMIYFGELNHSETNETDCEPDTNFTGKITLGCHRGTLSVVAGECKRHCLPSKIGPGVKAVNYPRFDHETELAVPCEPGFAGELLLNCDDGKATVSEGVCMMHCLPGAITTNSVRLDHPGFNHTKQLQLQCPIDPYPGFMGNVTVDCNDGATTFRGMCGHNCGPGHISSHGADLAWNYVIPHDETMNVSCPAPWQGAVLVGCYDGSWRYRGDGLHSNGGWCGRQCKSGNIKENAAVVYYPLMNHTAVANYGCDTLFNTPLTFSGGLTVTCNDGIIESDGYCEADCPDGNTWMNGAQVWYSGMVHLQESLAICTPGTPENPLYGKVVVQCQGGNVKPIEGSCGAPCLAGTFSGSETRDDPVAHQDVAHLTTSWVICPPHLSGYINLFCDNGIMSVVGNGTCGDRCPSKWYNLYGIALQTPVMEHRAKLEYDCDQPGFKGVAIIRCDFGFINATSLCQYKCANGTVTLPISDAEIEYPNMAAHELFSTRCPPGRYLDMPVVIKCVDGKGVVFSGGCFKNCMAGWYSDPAFPQGKSWEIQHKLLQHNTTRIEPCPQYFDGYITVACWAGQMSLKKGRCSVNCRPGRKQVRVGVVIRNAEMTSGQLGATIPCPPNFDGSMRILCTEGEVSLGEGGCNSTCSPGILATAPYGELGDSREAEIACPDVGTVNIRCNDGVITRTGGFCYRGCEGGTVIDANGTRIEYPYIRHGESTTGACSGLAKGVVTVVCNDTVVSQQPRPGERCLRHCNPTEVTTPGGTSIFAPQSAHGNQATVRCPNNLQGLVTLTCYDTEFTVTDGECGDMNCGEGAVQNNGASLGHFAMNNNWRGGPTECPSPWEGVATFMCNNGTVVVEEVTFALPVSPEDHEAVAIGAESSTDSRFILCECCNPEAVPPGAPPVKGRDTGILVGVAVAAGVMALGIAGFSGWYFLPRKKKVSRVWPEKDMTDNPRPVHEESVRAILDTFHMKLTNSPHLANLALERNLKLKNLPPAEQKLAIENMKKNPNAAAKTFSRRSMKYLMAVDEAQSPTSPMSPKSVQSIQSPQSPKSAGARARTPTPLNAIQDGTTSGAPLQSQLAVQDKPR